MSTRCQFGFYARAKDDVRKPQILIYRHNDGYPDAIFEDLMPPMQVFLDERGMDEEYFRARFVAAVCTTRPGVLSVGLCTGLHGDEEFFYRINLDTAEMICFKIPFEWKYGDGAEETKREVWRV